MQEEGATANKETPFYNKGRRYYHIGSYSLVAIILISVVFSFMLNNATFDSLRNFLTIALALTAYITIPIGLFNVVKSIRRKEPANKYRAYYLAALVFIQISLALLFIFMALGVLSNI